MNVLCILFYSAVRNLFHRYKYSIPIITINSFKIISDILQASIEIMFLLQSRISRPHTKINEFADQNKRALKMTTSEVTQRVSRRSADSV